MRTLRISMVLLSILFPCVVSSASPVVVDTIFPTDEIVVAERLVAPVGPSTDASGVIQAAIDATADAGGGTVFLRAGHYRLEHPILVRKNVTLRGDWAPPTAKGWQKGTVLTPVSGRGDENGQAAISLMANTGVRDLAIWYPDQNPARPVAYPWSISTSRVTTDENVNDAQTVMNVTLVNSYKGITIGPDYNYLHVLRNIYGSPLRTGIAIDRCFDIGRTQNVDLRPEWWEGSGLPGAPSTRQARAAFRAGLMKSATALDLGRDEWGYLYDVRVKGYGVGILVRPGFGNMNGVLFRCSFLDCGVAASFTDVSQYGIGATGCRFEGRECAVSAAEPFAGVLQFNRCSFRTGGKSGVRSQGTGTLSFANCSFSGPAATLIDAERGSVSAMGCDFGAARRHIALGKGVRRAIILGNAFAGTPSIRNDSKRIDLQLSHRRIGFAKPDISPVTPAPDRRPATRKLFLVTDFGAAPTSDDNTAAFTLALKAASEAGGGTVYAPAGSYRFKGNLVVPSGVELRGCFDVEHHTIGAGTALLPTDGRGNADGTPFIRLQPKSGLRGITIWYPDQHPVDVVAYPWAVQGLGPGCWVINLNCGNAYQGVDFWSYPSDGHVVKYLSGSFFRKGLFVSKCNGEGWVDDLHFNPHYGLRVDPALHPIAVGDWTPVMEYIRDHLDGIVFGRCEREQVKGTFLYAAREGLAFRDDNGGANARVIHHGTDTGSSCVEIDAAGSSGVELINTQLTPYASDVKGGIVVGERFKGKASLFNTMIWVPDQPAIDVNGDGDVLIQQVNNLAGRVTLRGGRTTLDGALFTTDRDPQILVEKRVASARVIGCVSRDGVCRIENRAGERCYARANSASLPLVSTPGAPTFSAGWESAKDSGRLGSTPLKPDMESGVSGAICHLMNEYSHSGAGSLRITGISEDPTHGYAYFRIFTEPIAVYPDTTLSYWMKPADVRSMSSGVDLEFAGGGDLRSSGATAEGGGGTHPTNPKGMPGQWTRIVIPLGKYFAEKTITSIMFAYDGQPGTGRFDTTFDDLTIESRMWNAPWRVTAQPAGGRFTGPMRVSLKAPGAKAIRYTLDGTPPNSGSMLYKEPIELRGDGLLDLRYAAVDADGSVSPCVFNGLYEVSR